MALLDTLRQERANEEKALQKRLQQWEKRGETLEQELRNKNDTVSRLQIDNGKLEQQLQTNQGHQETLKAALETAQRNLDQARRALEVEQQQSIAREEWQQQLWQRMEAMQAQLASLPEVMAPKSQE